MVNAARKNMYAVIQTGGKQYRVEPGDRLEIESLAEPKGASVTFDTVLLAANDAGVQVGHPTVPGASVIAEVMEHKRGKKVFAYKKRRREGYEKLIGHRQELSVIQIKEIKL